MSAEATGWVWQHADYTGATFVVALALADWANDGHGYELWASTESVARKAHVSRRAACRALAALTADGVLVLVESGQHAGKPSTYRWEGGVRHGVTPLRHGGAPGAPGGHTETEVDTQVQELSRASASTEDSLAASLDVLAEFDLWWREYPRHTDKAQARRRYQARIRAGTDTTALLAAAVNYARSCEHTDVRFIKHAATFLNGDDGPWSEWIDPTARAAESFRPDPYDQSDWNTPEGAALRPEIG